MDGAMTAHTAAPLQAVINVFFNPNDLGDTKIVISSSSVFCD